MHDGGIQWGDVATWVVGAVGAAIAWQQYRQSQFRPVVMAFRDKEPRIVVQIINKTNGAGVIQDVNLMPPDHPRKSVIPYWWEIDNQLDTGRRLVPFLLPGRASAQLVLRPGKDTNFDGIRIRVDYGDGKDSGCIDIRPTKGRFYGTTYIPKNSSA